MFRSCEPRFFQLIRFNVSHPPTSATARFLNLLDAICICTRKPTFPIDHSGPYKYHRQTAQDIVDNGAICNELGVANFPPSAPVDKSIIKVCPLKSSAKRPVRRLWTPRLNCGGNWLNLGLFAALGVVLKGSPGWQFNQGTTQKVCGFQRANF
jgi:hypothetical protein